MPTITIEVPVEPKGRVRKEVELIVRAVLFNDALDALGEILEGEDIEALAREVEEEAWKKIKEKYQL
ncbi:MAG: hypothetical protein GXO00_02110 [Candidatus Diapherotrites archaeon]|nr:hypothetical protein [Candidatus Diapherotrites archaeon]